MALSKKSLLKLRKISLLCLFLSIPINLLGVLLRFGYLTIIGTPLLLLYICFSLVFWKCPHCKERLPMKFNHKDDEFINDVDGNYRCPYCNKELD
jgi:phage FluMu protein Com